MKYSGAAKVQLTVVITNGSSYGPEWKIEDMIKQVTDEAILNLRQKMQGSLVEIIGEPIATAVFLTEAKQGFNSLGK